MNHDSWLPYRSGFLPNAAVGSVAEVRRLDFTFTSSGDKAEAFWSAENGRGCAGVGTQFVLGRETGLLVAL